MKKRTLKWGATPWDDMPREELLRETQRLYAALNSSHHALAMTGHGQTSGFWDRGNGSGGQALAMGEMVLGAIHARHDSENIYRMFFRYAVDLLFTPKLGFGWAICDKCGQMIGAQPGGDPPVGEPCRSMRKGDEPHGPMRLLEWDDLRPGKWP